MTKVFHTEQAKADLLDIWAYIAEDNPNAADRLLEAIGYRCSLLGDSPKLGRERPDIAPTMRYFPMRNYLIIYHEIERGIEIVRVVHGSRDLSALFGSDD